MDEDQLVTITLEGVRAIGRHGVLDSERANGQPFIVDLSIGVEPPGADDISQAVDYSRLAAQVVESIAGDPVDLIETLADRIIDEVLTDPRIRWAQVCVHKPEAPVPVQFADLSVTIRRRNHE